MNITVFGGTGKIGRLVVKNLLDAGHDVTAVVRTPGKLTVSDPRLNVRQAELTDVDAIRAALAGSDAVISALGPSLKRGATGTPLTDATRSIVTAMREAGVRRFIGLATPSVPDRQDRPTLKARVLPVMANLLFPNALTELRGMTAAVTASDLEWTLARITNPTDKPARGTVRSGFLGRDKVGSAMSRADIASFLVDQLEDTRYVRSAPAISN